jgi:hypothetical protein
MGAQDRSDQPGMPKLQQPEEAIKDLEPEEDQAKDVKGGLTMGWDLKANQKV